MKQVKTRVLSLMLIVSMSAFLFAGCGTESKKAGNEDDKKKVESVESKSSKPTKDCAGNDITIPDDVERIVSMAPSVTQTLIDFGYADKIIACDTYSGFSALSESLNPDIPQFDMMSPDNEAIIALNPDIVFTTGMSYANDEDVYSALKSSGVCVADIPSPDSIDGIKEDLQFIADAIGASAVAKSVIEKMDDFSDSVEKISKEISEKKTVLYIMSVPTPDYPDVYTCGKGTYMDEIFTMIGAENVAGDIDYQWPSLSEEDIISKNPDVIIVGDTYTENPVDAIMAIDAWKDVSAIKNSEVYAIDGDSFNQPNQYVMNSAYDIAKAVYPDLYKDIEKPFE